MVFGMKHKQFMVKTSQFTTKCRLQSHNSKTAKIKIIDLLYRFGRLISGDYYANIRLAVAKGGC